MLKFLNTRFVLLLSLLLAGPLLAARPTQANVDEPIIIDDAIIDSDPITGIESNVPGVNVSPTHVDVTEGGVSGSYAVVLTARPSAPVTVTVQPDEQVAPSATALIFDEANWSIQQVVVVTAVDDWDIEAPLHVGAITHSVASADEDYDGLGVSDVAAIITDNDTIRTYLPLAARSLAPRYELDDAPDACPGHPVEVGYFYGDDWDHEGDEDWYTFQASAGMTYTIETSDLVSDTDTVLALFGADCATQLDKNDDIEPGSRASRIVWQAPEAGVYHVLARSFDGQVYGADTGYTLSVSGSRQRGDITDLRRQTIEFIPQ